MDELLLPLLPVMVMLPVVPSSAIVGVPANAPVAASKEAQAGCRSMLNVTPRRPRRPWAETYNYCRQQRCSADTGQFNRGNSPSRVGRICGLGHTTPSPQPATFSKAISSDSGGSAIRDFTASAAIKAPARGLPLKMSHINDLMQTGV